MSANLPGPAPSGLGGWIAAGILGVAAMIGLAWFGTRGVAGPAAAIQGYLAENARKAGVTVLPSGVQVEVLKGGGSGTAPGAQDFVLVQYEGRLTDGTVFDSSYARGQPAAFGVGDVIPGLAEALQRMKPGEKHRITIPPALAYGREGAGNGVIPPNSVLVFEVELLQVAAGG
ncbi:FKBP-type peptidyl-prolyl cis-trans isomerase [Thermaurantiacus tibetensis]|uniref:FKBP-type peptidyl-prolyl cis-trans isomerase n=1 Tax=Thermaurantiacus tibetensis TaxID=2759035 RepID=UPI002E2802CA|nr:FKBP-type peptidyl-prolyl cis-trans isomerase [Thermaurantiacus tibetensis]